MLLLLTHRILGNKRESMRSRELSGVDIDRLGVGNCRIYRRQGGLFSGN